MDSFSSSSTYSSIVLAISAVTSRPCTTISSGRWNCQSCSSGSRSGLVLLFALALFSMTATNASSAAIGGSGYFLLEAEPAFADGSWPTGILPINSRQFVGIRTVSFYFSGLSFYTGLPNWEKSLNLTTKVFGHFRIFKTSNKLTSLALSVASIQGSFRRSPAERAVG